jgi:hypothetical protein
LSDGKFLRNVILKAMILFALVNFLFVAANPVPFVARFSLYNSIFPGRERLPFGENPDRSYNLSLYNMDAMFAAHIVASKPPKNEYRVFIIGDSSVWGTLLKPEETLAGQLNSMHLTTCEGRPVHFYNLGYPTLSVTKDLMVLDKSIQYHPDQIIWLFTLESFPISRQFESPIVANNPGLVTKILQENKLDLNLNSIKAASLWDQTLWGQRRALADLFRLQLYGVMWAATGIDQDYPAHYPPAQRDFEKLDLTFEGITSQTFQKSDLALNMLDAGMKMAGSTPVVFVNEPMLISTGKGSEGRYNFYYPRWIYDKYRQIIQEDMDQNHWNYLDAWNVISEKEFTNSAIHLTPKGESVFVQYISDRLQENKFCK